MIKRVFLFLIVPLMFLISACGGAAPQNSYASDIQPALEKLTAWEKLNTNFVDLLNQSVGSQNGMTRLDMIDLYNMAAAYKITRDDYAKLGFLPLDVLVGDATKIAKEGHTILDILSAATPAEEVKPAHTALVQCVQARVTFAEGLVSSIKNLTPIDLSGDASSCSTFDADLAKLTAYVNGHK
jgi:hypothetical protein